MSHATRIPAWRSLLLATCDAHRLPARGRAYSAARETATETTANVDLVWHCAPSNHGLSERHALKLQQAQGEAESLSTSRDLGPGNKTRQIES